MYIVNYNNHFDFISQWNFANILMGHLHDPSCLDRLEVINEFEVMYTSPIRLKKRYYKATIKISHSFIE
jgi:hypothetical protein